MHDKNAKESFDKEKDLNININLMNASNNEIDDDDNTSNDDSALSEFNEQAIVNSNIILEINSQKDNECKSSNNLASTIETNYHKLQKDYDELNNKYNDLKNNNWDFKNVIFIVY